MRACDVLSQFIDTTTGGRGPSEGDHDYDNRLSARALAMAAYAIVHRSKTMQDDEFERMRTAIEAMATKAQVKFHLPHSEVTQAAMHLANYIHGLCD